MHPSISIYSPPSSNQNASFQYIWTTNFKKKRHKPGTWDLGPLKVSSFFYQHYPSKADEPCLCNQSCIDCTRETKLKRNLHRSLHTISLLLALRNSSIR
jgi:hypothetical protein